MDELNWPLMLGAGIVASASPGPATLGIAGISMRHGRLSGLVLAAGIVTGSYFWSITAALGFGAILMAHVWILETVRYCGAAYLLYLACRSLRAAMSDTEPTMTELKAPHGYFMAGLMLHLTNPKPVLFFGILFRSVFPREPEHLIWPLLFLSLGCATQPSSLPMRCCFPTRCWHGSMPVPDVGSNRSLRCFSVSPA